jgi:hypothetical protein
MPVIHKYQIPVDGNLHSIDITGPVIHVEAASDTLVNMWAISGLVSIPEKVHYCVVSTGNELPKNAVHVGTTSRTPNGFVWHLIEVPLPS